MFNDHYVARTYLKKFTYDGGSTMFSYHKQSNQLERKNVKSVASEINFNTLSEELVGQGNKRFLEREMEKLDSQFARDRDVLVRLAKTGETIGNALKISLSKYIGSQFYRTRFYREMMKSAMETAIGRGEFYNPGEPEVKNGVMSNELVSYRQAQSILEHSQHLANIYYDTEWILGVNQTQLPFFTSDFPLVDVPAPGLRDPTGKHRWYALPITPYLILRMFPPLTGNGAPDIRERTITSEDHVGHYNWAQIWQSHLRVFSNVDHIDFCRKFCEIHPQVRTPRQPIEQGVNLMNAQWVRDLYSQLRQKGD